MFSRGRSSNLMIFIVSIMLGIGALLLWWTNTVIAVLLLMAATILVLGILCNCCTVDMSDRVTRARAGYPRSRGSYARKFDEEMERERRRIPGRMDPSLLPHEIPIEVLEGPTPTHIETLMRVGVSTISDLIYFGAESIIDVCDVDIKTAEHWITDSRGIYEVAGLKTLEELAAADPDTLVETILLGMEMENIPIPEQYTISDEKTTYWISIARDLLN